VDIAEQLQDVGICALTIHGRTRAQLYRGSADWSLIAAVKNNPRMKIPIIGNGDIVSPESAREAFDRYGVDAIMIGRATVGRPWIFRDIRHYLETGEILPDLTLNEKIDLARLQFDKSLEVKGVPRGIFEMRRHFSNYFKGLPDFREIRMKLVTSLDPVEIYGLLERIRVSYPQY
jgi:tRNA-dihydrouridine synthase